MASTYTSRITLEKQADGENDTTWGQKVNTVFDLLDEALGGYQSIAISGNFTATQFNGISDEVRQAVTELTGSLVASYDYILPAKEGVWAFKNSCTGGGGYTITVKPSGGTGVALEQGETAIIYSNGTNAYPIYRSTNHLVTSNNLSDVTASTARANLDIFGAGRYWGTATTVAADNSTRVSGQKHVLVPTGTIFPYAGSSTPSGWLFCYGQAISRATYADLFGVLSTTYGVGDGSTTFNLPDLRGRTIAGRDDMGGSAASRLTNSYFGMSAATLGATGGLESHTLTVAQLASHSHTVPDTRGGGSVDAANAGLSGGNSTFTSNTAGSNAPHNNVQPTIILNYIIKY